MELTRHRFTVEDYHAMGEAGIFSEDDRVELLNGEVVEMAPIGSRHVRVVNALADLFADSRPPSGSVGTYTISVQNPVVIGPDYEPQPDLALLRDERDREGLPAAADALLLVEVADTSSKTDREQKLPAYARAGIPETWLVDLTTGAVEIHSRPGRMGYETVSRFRGGQSVRSTALLVLSFEAARIFPPE